MCTYYRFIATFNFLGVIGYMAGIDWLLWLIVFTAIVLFSDGITSHDQSTMAELFQIGAIFNFMGIVAGGISGIKSVLIMAIFGSVLLLIAYWADQPSTTISTPENSDVNASEE